MTDNDDELEFNENLSPRRTVERKVRVDSKYDPKYTRQLRAAIRRKKGYSILELCSKWRICTATYYKWIERFPEFKAAHELGMVDAGAYWHKEFREVATGQKEGNAGCLQFAMKNIEGIQWSDKASVSDSSEDAPIGHITINVLPAPPRALAQQQANIIEAETVDVPVKNNVVELKPKE